MKSFVTDLWVVPDRDNLWSHANVSDTISLFTRSDCSVLVVFLPLTLTSIRHTQKNQSASNHLVPEDMQ